MGKKLTIEVMYEEARKHGGECLSTEYINNRHKLHWRCSEGHTWFATPFAIRNGKQWCPICARANMAHQKRIKLEELIAVIEQKEGKLLSTEYFDLQSKLTISCKEGHIWTSKAVNIWHDRWCPRCSRVEANKKTSHSIEYMHEIASSREGRCLSKEYINSKTPLKWQCGEGHVWEQVPCLIIRGNWCPVCYRDTIDTLKDYAIAKEGLCLSNTYYTTTYKYTWQCKEGHTWKAPWSNVKKGHWCKECCGKAKKTIKDLKMIAKKRGGKLLSTTYKNRHTPLQWRCRHGHEFELPYAAVYSKQWCPHCRFFVGEEITRAVVEDMFKRPFPKKYPEWLKGVRHRKMELDGFCEPLGIAFEHQGNQHFEVVERFHPNGVSDLLEQQERDEIKRLLCKERSIALLEVPEFGTLTKTLEDLEALVLAFAKEHKLEINKDYALSKIDFDALHKFVQSNIQELQAFAKKEQGGQLLSKLYFNATHKLEWKCRKGHTFMMHASAVRNAKQWCPKCGRERSAILRRKHTIESVNNAAKKKGGVCLSSEMSNIDDKLDWECEHGHRWSAVAYDVVSGGHWCPTCGNNAKLTIPELQTLAKEKGGSLLSTEYINSKSKLKWLCCEGHEFMMCASAVKNAKQWCPICGHKKKNDSRRGTIEQMRKLAASRGGRCLSETYTNSITHLRWICHENHEWMARPDKVKQGSWCPVCRNLRLRKSTNS